MEKILHTTEHRTEQIGGAECKPQMRATHYMIINIVKSL